MSIGKTIPYVNGDRRAIRVCIDSLSRGVILGRIVRAQLPRGTAFTGFEGFVRQMEELLAGDEHPMPSFETRSFTGLIPQKKLTPKKEGDALEEQDMTTSIEKDGKKATFIVRVQFRQNGTWQGTADWVEEKKSQRFRSMLELIRLMDDALTRGEDGEAPPGWEEK